ncbi:MAG TPA: hypothetical protein VKC90_05780 [Chitinophagaceae bacterium]|nr:hypothetical protein [Chitinophagaceae bacterium]
MKKDYLIEIYKVEAEKYNKTRDIHWKVNLSICTVLVVLIYAKLEGKIRNLPLFFQGFVLLSFIGLHIIFIRNIHQSLSRSLTRLHNIAAHLLEQDENAKMKWVDFNKKTPYGKYGWEYWQLGITIFLIAIFYLINQ